MSERGQIVMVWWSIIAMLMYGFTLWGLMGMVPPPPATLSPEQVAAFYMQGAAQTKIGATICSWVSAFMVPFTVVVTAQMLRLEKGIPFWSIMQLSGGLLMSIFLVLPPMFWGMAAFDPSRPPAVTALMHEIAMLTFVTTDQYYIFQMLAIAVICLSQKKGVASALPRWLGFVTIWAALLFEVGAIAYNTRTGPFSWNGVIVFWLPFFVFGAWMLTVATTIIQDINRRLREAPRENA